MKKRTIKKIIAAGCVGAAAFSLIACSGNSSQNASEQAETVEEVSSAATDDTSAAADDTTKAAVDNPGTSDYADYVGKTFEGKDPWGGDLTFEIKSVEDETLETVYTDVISDELTLYAEEGGIPLYDDGEAPFAAGGTAKEDDMITFTYSGMMQLTDGQLEITYQAGGIDNGNDGADPDEFSDYEIDGSDESEVTVTLTLQG